MRFFLSILILGTLLTLSHGAAETSVADWATLISEFGSATGGESFVLDGGGPYGGASCSSVGATLSGVTDVTLKAPDGETVVIDCSTTSGSRRGLVLSLGATLHVINVTFVGFTHTANAGVLLNRGAAVNLQAGSEAVFENVVFANNAALDGGSYDGGAVAIHESLATFINCVFEHNSATDRGGAVFIEEELTVGSGSPGGTSFINTVFRSNTANVGGAIDFERAASGALGPPERRVVIKDSLFEENEALVNPGGALHIRYHYVNITSSRFVNNTNKQAPAGWYGGAVSIVDQSKVWIDNSYFAHNLCTGGGGAVGINGAFRVEIANSTFANNTNNFGVGWEGGAILNQNINAFVVRDSVFLGNIAGRGGAIGLKAGAKLELAGKNVFRGNTAFVSGGALYSDSGSVDYMDTELIFHANSVTFHGGAIAAISTSLHTAIGTSSFIFTANQADGWGGALFLFSGSAFTAPPSSSFLFEDNTADYGGAISIRSSASASFSTPLTILSNTAAQDGGGIEVRGGSSMIVDAAGSVVRGNVANIGGGVSMNDPGTSTSLLGVTIESNSATLFGGGYSLFVTSGPFGNVIGVDTPILGSSTLRTNTAGMNGGGMFMANVSDSVLFDNLLLERNVAEDAGHGAGGGLAVTRGTKELLFFELEVVANTAPSGGGVAVVDPASSVDHGVSIKQLVARDNVATQGYGGGVLVASQQGDVDLYLYGHTEIEGNTAAVAGGGLAVYNTKQLLGSIGSPLYSFTMARNSAPLGAAIYMTINETGHTRPNYPAMERVTIQDHTFAGDGALVHLGQHVGLNMSRIVIRSNNASEGAPMLEFTSQADVSFDGLYIVGNTGSGMVVGSDLLDGDAINVVITNNTYDIRQSSSSSSSSSPSSVSTRAVSEVAGLVCGTGGVGGVTVQFTGSSSVCRNLVRGVANVTDQDMGPSCSSLGTRVTSLSSASLSNCPSLCGNGILEGNEVCDDWNTDVTDGCDGCFALFGYVCTTSILTPSECERLPTKEEPDEASHDRADGVVAVLVYALVLLLIVLILLTLLKRRKGSKAAMAEGAVVASFWQKLVTGHVFFGVVVFDSASADPFSRPGRVVAFLLSSSVILVSIVATPLVNEEHYAAVADDGVGGRALIWLSSSLVGLVCSLVFGVPLVRSALRSGRPILAQHRTAILCVGCVATGLAWAIAGCLFFFVVEEGPSLPLLVLQWVVTLLLDWLVYTPIIVCIQFWLWKDRVLYRIPNARADDNGSDKELGRVTQDLHSSSSLDDGDDSCTSVGLESDSEEPVVVPKRGRRRRRIQPSATFPSSSTPGP